MSDLPGGPSEAAVNAIAKLLDGAGWTHPQTGPPAIDVAQALLTEAHDPALGTDRSVNLGAVLDWLRNTGEPPVMVGRDLSGQIVYGPSCATRAADAIERELGGGSDAD